VTSPPTVQVRPTRIGSEAHRAAATHARRASWPVGAAVGTAAFVLIARGGDGADAWIAAALAVAIGWSFLASGRVLWAREEENPLGALMTGLGLAWLTGAAVAESGSDAGTWIGLVLIDAALAMLVHVVVAFPDGRLRLRRERLLVGAMYVNLVALAPISIAVRGDSVPRGPASLVRSEPFASSLGGLPAVVAVLLAAALGWLLWRRWYWATRHVRRTFAVIFGTAGAGVVLLVAGAVAADASEEVGRVLGWSGLVAVAVTPLAILAGILRSRLARARAAELLRELESARTPGAVRDALRHALGDPELRIAYWTSDARGFVDLRGRPFELPWEGSSQVATMVERDGRRVAALVHDASLRNSPELLEAVTSAAGLALENERLHAELRARVDDLRESRARIVQAGDAERRRLERNLHDGAQQRLVSVLLNLRLVEAKLKNDPQAAAPLVTQTREDLAEALEELRELARGIHPAILSDRGLGPALEAAAARSAVPVELSTPDERLPQPVEAAIYYVVSEALANVAKYAQASRVTVEVARADGRAVVAVADDGVGGADLDAGSGLRGLADRVAALDGRLSVDSPPSGGTRIHAEIPCA
jgi:signal transduction histidine kinase